MHKVSKIGSHNQRLTISIFGDRRMHAAPNCIHSVYIIKILLISTNNEMKQTTVSVYYTIVFTINSSVTTLYNVNLYKWTIGLDIRFQIKNNCPHQIQI